MVFLLLNSYIHLSYAAILTLSAHTFVLQCIMTNTLNCIDELCFTEFYFETIFNLLEWFMVKFASVVVHVKA